MNSLEAKFILEACRSGDLDADDPKIAEALRALESDAELARWFAEVQELDRAIATKLKSVPVPEVLLARIRAGEVSSPAPAPRLTRRRWLAIAAAGVAAAVPATLLLTRSRPGSLATFRNDMAAFMDGWNFAFDLDEIDFVKVRDWLQTRGTLEKVAVPAVLAGSSTIGCKTLRWRGNRAALICFSPRGVGATIHFFAVARRAVIDPPSVTPASLKLPKWNSAAWADENNVYLALTTADPDKLSRCL